MSRGRKRKYDSDIVRWITKNGRRIPIRRLKARRYPPRMKIVRRDPPSIQEHVTYDTSYSVVKGLLDGALLYGLSTIFPPLSFLVPSYHLYNYGRFGIALYQLYNSLKNSESVLHRRKIKPSLVKMAEPYGNIVSQPVADIISRSLVKSAKEAGIISSVAKSTLIDENVYTHMLEGSLSNGISSGVGNFTAYSVGRIMGV